MKLNKIHSLPFGLLFGMMILMPALGWAQTDITSLGDITDMAGHYRLTANVSGAGHTTITGPFTGTLEAAIDPATKMPYRITGLDKPLFSTLSGTVKNLVLENVAISQTGKVGAIACEANGSARVYNVGILSGSVGSTGTSTGDNSNDCCGGLVGLLGGQAHVINCYSYATITGGNRVGGIVGYNGITSTQSNINTTTHQLEATMVMNCMFYGDIIGGEKVSPVYNGKIINNLNSGGLSNFNYYAYDKLKTKPVSGDGFYLCALALEERYLSRFELYRLLLNSNKRLAAIYITGSADDENLMLKWVLETADRTIANPKPYPILKDQGYYPSIINPDIANAPDSTAVGPNKGGKLGRTLSVTISAPSGWTNAPDGAKLLDADGNEISDAREITLTRTDKDFDRFNFNYDKVQLPYYNDYGTKNYTDYKVVTGWKITHFEGGTAGTYTASDTWGGYNFADRKCTNKDLYGTGGSNRVFSQGAYFDVPYGVTAITIEPYWGKAAYLADQYYDVVYKSDYARQNVENFGKQVESTTQYNGQNVKTNAKDALGTITSPGSTVYDNAIVLVGNFHQNNINGEPYNKTTPFTLMSVDEDNDHEPDYSLIFHDNNRTYVCPIRFDFLNVPGTAQAKKPNGTSTLLNVSIFNPKSWFEITNTTLIFFSQFEYENITNKTQPAPIILLGGVFDQFVSTKVSDPHSTTYLHVGGNAWFKAFGNGTHSDGNKKTKHIPISATGGEYEGFYLTGTYNQSAGVYTDNAECYISSGHFVEAAGASQEKIDGNVQWQIYNADMDNFYGGGTNEASPITGDVTVDIINSHVTTYCGGPKFGNMQSGKKVTTNAKGCTFGKFFGAGYGGISYARVKYFDEKIYDFNTLQNYYYDVADDTGDRGKYFTGANTNASSSHPDYGKKGPGVATDFDYEFFIWSNGVTGARFFVKFASFSLARCNDVESNLTNCTINESFYGGGSLGKVEGTTTSVLNSCTVKGNVYGAGYSATLPTIEVRDAGFKQTGVGVFAIPKFNKYNGMFEPGEFSNTTTFTWKQGTFPAEGGPGFDGTKVLTDVELTPSNLGSVHAVTLTIKGNSKIGTAGNPNTGHVFGGGEESYVTGSTTVTTEDNTEVLGNVFGGGKAGVVEENTTVIIKDHTKVRGNIYGGGDMGEVGGNTKVIVNGQ